jgi:hypothetical protein
MMCPLVMSTCAVSGILCQEQRNFSDKEQYEAVQISQHR